MDNSNKALPFEQARKSLIHARIHIYTKTDNLGSNVGVACLWIKGRLDDVPDK